MTKPLPGPLARTRFACGMSRADLGAKAGLHPITIWRLETGRSEPKRATMYALAAALGTPVTTIFPP